MNYHLVITKSENTPKFDNVYRSYGFERQFNILLLFVQKYLAPKYLNKFDIDVSSSSFKEDTDEKIDFFIRFIQFDKVVYEFKIDVKTDDISKIKDFDKITFTLLNRNGIKYFDAATNDYILFYLNHLDSFFLIKTNNLKSYIIQEKFIALLGKDKKSKYIWLNTDDLNKICEQL